MVPLPRTLKERMYTILITHRGDSSKGTPTTNAEVRQVEVDSRGGVRTPTTNAEVHQVEVDARGGVHVEFHGDILNREAP